MMTIEQIADFCDYKIDSSEKVYYSRYLSRTSLILGIVLAVIVIAILVVRFGFNAKSKDKQEKLIAKEDV